MSHLDDCSCRRAEESRWKGTRVCGKVTQSIDKRNKGFQIRTRGGGAQSIVLEATRSTKSESEHGTNRATVKVKAVMDWESG